MEGFAPPVQKARAVLAGLPVTSVNKILGDNAVKFYGI
jgi:hypothetical protein